MLTCESRTRYVYRLYLMFSVLIPPPPLVIYRRWMMDLFAVRLRAREQLDVVLASMVVDCRKSQRHC